MEALKDEGKSESTISDLVTCGTWEIKKLT
jgi:hypothetical protein